MCTVHVPEACAVTVHIVPALNCPRTEPTASLVDRVFNKLALVIKYGQRPATIMQCHVMFTSPVTVTLRGQLGQL